jgi:hypothetical protein
VGGVQVGPLGTAATNGPIVPAPGIMTMDKLVEWLADWQEKTCPSAAFVHHKPHMLPGRKPGPPRWEASD